ncbi:helix-turn-helix domain-containing protein [Sinosporangium siamense]|uniref:DNA-binding protein n=1 Tax=Sinosporangium siamense TaxID=1367973 RepID=A0A919V609_9ACTN|nr:cupin domain-containing protein [Sinosporangium siamense]GII90497.1 DNA-binding protein [Sinosporangium siamense]
MANPVTGSSTPLRSEALGAGLRAARQERGLSIRALARTLGCSASLLSQIERGVTAPSVGMLYMLAGELGVSIDRLLNLAIPEVPQEPPPAERNGSGRPEPWHLIRSLPPSLQAQVQRATGRQAVDFGSGVRWERLTTTADSRVDFMEIVYAPGSSSEEQVGHEGYEYGIVIEGSLTGRIGTEEYVLNAGDSISFASSTPHHYRNDGEITTRAIWFVLHTPHSP